MLINRIIILMILTSVFGCASRPSLVYSKLNAESTSSANQQKPMTDSYFLNASKVMIQPSKVKDETGNTLMQYKVTSEPVEFLNFKVGVTARNTWISTTKLNITKAENSDRYSTGGTDTTDNVKSLISTIGGIAVKAVAMTASLPPAPVAEPAQVVESCTKFLTDPFQIEYSKIIDSENIPNMPIRVIKNDPATTCIQITLGPLPPDAREMRFAPWEVSTSDYFYAACRNLTVTVKGAEQQEFSHSVRISDPRFFQSVQYPFKGVVSMHSQCGISVKTDALSNPLAGLDSFSELLKQISAISDAKK